MKQNLSCYLMKYLLGFPPIQQLAQYISSLLTAINEDEWLLIGKILETLYYPSHGAGLVDDSVSKVSTDGTDLGDFEGSHMFL